MRDHFRVATTATNRRRTVYVHLYDDVEELALQHCKARNMAYSPGSDIGGGLAVQQGHMWPSPEYGPVTVMRLWTGQLTTRTIAHEATHAAAYMYFMDCLPGWDTRARTVLGGGHEPLAYAVGDITARVIEGLYERGYLP